MGGSHLRRTTQGTHQSEALSESHKDWKSDPRNRGWVCARARTHMHTGACTSVAGGRYSPIIQQEADIYPMSKLNGQLHQLNYQVTGSAEKLCLSVHSRAQLGKIPDICLDLHIYMHTHTWTHTHTHKHAHICTHAHIYVQTHIHSFTHANTYIYMCTYTYTQTCTHTLIDT